MIDDGADGELVVGADGRLSAAPLGLRFAAALVDGVTLRGALALLGTVVPGVGNGQAVMAATCVEDNVVGPGRSIGRKATGLRLVREDGSVLDHGTALKRNVLNVVIHVGGIVLLAIPTFVDFYLIVLGDGRRIADRICDTVVIADPRN